MSKPTIRQSVSSRQGQTSQSTTNASLPKKKPASSEDIYMRRVTLYYVMALCTFTQVASLVAFFLSRNLEAAFLFQLPALLFLYRILCYLYPADEGQTHPVIAIIQMILKHKSP